MPRNKEKFDHLRSFDLPLGEYLITGSGPLGIRNLKEIGDIDIIVTDELWEELENQFGAVEENGVIKIVFPGGLIEAFKEGSFKGSLENIPRLAERIAHSEIIDGLAFDTLETILYFKKKERRKKDLIDIDIIESYLRS